MTTRLETLETDVALLKHTAVHTADILVDHTGRLDQIQRQLSGVEHRLSGVEHRLSGVEHRVSGVEHRLSGVEHRLESLEHRFDAFQESIESRLDRLIALTLEERTASAERFQRLENRLEKLEG